MPALLFTVGMLNVLQPAVLARTPRYFCRLVIILVLVIALVVVTRMPMPALPELPTLPSLPPLEL